MQVMGCYFDGCVFVVLGIYIYVVMVDEQVFFGGIVFQCDVGMIGFYLSILGCRIDWVVEMIIQFWLILFDVVSEDV